MTGMDVCFIIVMFGAAWGGLTLIRRKTKKIETLDDLKEKFLRYEDG